MQRIDYKIYRMPALKGQYLFLLQNGRTPIRRKVYIAGHVHMDKKIGRVRINFLQDDYTYGQIVSVK